MLPASQHQCQACLSIRLSCQASPTAIGQPVLHYALRRRTDKFPPHLGKYVNTDSAIASTVNCSNVACTSAGFSSPDKQLSSQARLNFSLPALFGGGREKNGREEVFQATPGLLRRTQPTPHFHRMSCPYDANTMRPSLYCRARSHIRRPLRWVRRLVRLHIPPILTMIR